MARFRTLVGRLRWIHLAPVLAFVALSAWAFASPLGAAPDDDYHLVSTWCAVGGSAECQPGPTDEERSLDPEFGGVTCYAGHREESAACQFDAFDESGRFITDRGNFAGEYPPVYYAVMRAFAGPDIQVSALVMRLVNAALFVALATALSLLLTIARRSTLIWGWLIAVIPLGIFLIPSNNPSGWAITASGPRSSPCSAGSRRRGDGTGCSGRCTSSACSWLPVPAATPASTSSARAWSPRSSRSPARDPGCCRRLLPVAGVIISVVFFVSAGNPASVRSASPGERP